MAFLVPQTVKNLPAMWETWVRSLCGEDPLEKGMATHSSILPWMSYNISADSTVDCTVLSQLVAQLLWK